MGITIGDVHCGSSERLAVFDWHRRKKARSCCSVLIAGLAILLVVGRDPAARASEPDADAGRTAGAVKEKLAELAIKPRTTESITEKVLRTRNAIRHSEFLAARRVIEAVLADSHIQDWRYYPFQDFVSGVPDVNDATFEGKLDEWVHQSKDDLIPLIIRAQYNYEMGWLKRGHEFASDTSVSQITAFNTYMGKALIDVDAAIKLDDRNPYTLYLKLLIVRSYGITEGLDRSFQDAIAKHPGYYPLYDIALQTLQPRWGGTPEAMHNFVNRYAESVPEDSPLKLLYLSLYRYLLSTASVSCSGFQRSARPDCVRLYMGEYASPDLEAHVEVALRLYSTPERHQFRMALRNVVLDMLRIQGGEAYSGAVLELAASAMHSDTRLHEPTSGHNDYVIDELVAESWIHKGFYDNAEKKYRQALKDIEFATFPSSEEKNSALSYIYDRFAYINDKLHQYVDVIAYQKAATAVGGITGNEHRVCYGYYKLKQYDEAVRTGTYAIEEAENLTARYWRGFAYYELKQPQSALDDLKIIADSQNGFRTSAAIQMSLIYDEIKDFKSSLELLTSYKFLYDEKTQDKRNIAVSYNNRCYAHMELGDLKKALDDCTASLKYDSLPDAYRKQQELVKRLKLPGKDS